MPSLQIYFNNALQEEIPLSPNKVVTIGRKPENDLTIDNLAVSSRHARVVHMNGTYYMEDTQSTNGTYLNGQKIQRHALSNGDMIAICKHNIKYVDERGLPTSYVEEEDDSGDTVQQESPPSLDDNEIKSEGTVLFGASKMKSVLHEHELNAAIEKGQTTARIIVVDRAQTYTMSHTTFKMGKKKEADLPIGGWFAPKLSAVINRRRDGYYLMPQKRGKVKVNGKAISETEKLKDGDTFQVRGVNMKFSITRKKK